jgi:3-deoxy-manno-octulosonate cytidylyltransferase (CMP-KDO synthetase)
MKKAIIIPARYGSTRFPGKPLTLIAGQTMLSRVVQLAQQSCAARTDTDIMVATEDARIATHCNELGITCIMTDDDCHTGSDRVLQAAQRSDNQYDVLVSLQGDAPFTPPSAIEALLSAFDTNPLYEVVTPIVQLRWPELDALRQAKQITPFSGTTCVVDSNGQALWFSKNIIPAIRKEEALRKTSAFSPVHQHMGLYAYRTDILERFVSLPYGTYEELEGLEQLRLLENKISIQTVTISVALGMAQAGIDSPEDVARAEAMLEKVASS